MRELGRTIIVGDTHFGIKRFSINVLEEQLKLWEVQIFPYMLENGITEIFQLGDLFDNRTMANIKFLDTLQKKFFDVIKENGFTLHSLLGNHDIFERDSREISIVQTFQKLYPLNFISYKNKEHIMLAGCPTLVQPWICSDEELDHNDLIGQTHVLGHFEIRDFSVVKGHVDKDSKLSKESFKGLEVYSGHYHLRNVEHHVKYLGTPTYLNWNDFSEIKGFYDFDGELTFIQNISTKKYVKVIYNDTDDDKEIEVQGLFNKHKIFNHQEFKDIIPYLEQHEVKFIISKSKTKAFDDVIQDLKEQNVQPSVINQQEVNIILHIDEDMNENLKGSEELIIDSLKSHNPLLVKEAMSILTEIRTESKGDE